MNEKKKSSRSLKELAWGVGFLVFGGLLTWSGVSTYRQDSNIERSGHRAEGHLTKKNAWVAYEGDQYDIEYWFTLPGGERIEASKQVSEGLWKKLREGGTFTVMYSAADPHENFPLGGSDASIWTLVGTAIGVIMTLVGVLLVTFFFARPELLD